MSYLPDDTSGEDFTEEAAAEDLSRISDDDLESSIPAMQRRIDSLQARLALRVAEYDRRGLADTRHLLRTTQWLAHTLRIAKSHASTLLRTGRTLEEMPRTAPLATAGAITALATRKLTAARNRHPEAFLRHEGVLAEAATYLTPSDLRRAINHWEQQVDYPDAIAEMRSRRRRRRLSVNQTWDGMWAIKGELDPESGSVVSTCLRAHVDASRLAESDGRTSAQRMADALVEVCDRDLTGHDHPTSGGVKPHVTVTLDFDQLRQRSVSASTLEESGLGGSIDPTAPGRPGHEIDSNVPSHPPAPELDGLAVTPDTVRRLSCDATVLPMVLGSDAEVLDIGRATRVIPTGMRRALDARDRGCSWTGCDAPLAWCDAHHITHWADGGDTALENLRLLCRRHHTAVHELDGVPHTDRAPP